MTLPRNVASAILEAELSVPRGGGWFADGDSVCEGSSFHSPHVLVVRDVWLSPDNRGKTVGLCGTCADNLGVLKELLLANDGKLPWPVRREFGNKLRALAEEGWNGYMKRKKR